MSDTIKPQDLENILAQDPDIVLVDVRRASDRDADPDMIPGAVWRDPDKADEWGGGLGDKAVIYCARGGSISASVQAKLRDRGVDARYVEGGIAAWRGTEVRKNGK
jgi:rhodanese-related sulfurtransferase